MMKKNPKLCFWTADFSDHQVIIENPTVPVSAIQFWTIWAKKISKKIKAFFVKVELR